MSNIRQYLDEFFSELCMWDETQDPVIPHGLIGYITVTLAKGEEGSYDNNLIEIERLKLLYQIYKDEGGCTVDSIDSVAEKLDKTNYILKHRDMARGIHLGVSHALADMLDMGGVRELLEKIAGENNA